MSKEFSTPNTAGNSLGSTQKMSQIQIELAHIGADVKDQLKTSYDKIKEQIDKMMGP